MDSQTTAAAIDDFEELIQMNITGSIQEELLTWLDKHGIAVSRSTLVVWDYGKKNPIQAVSDLAALCRLRQSSCRGKPFKWNKAEGTAANTTPHRDNETKTTAGSMRETTPFGATCSKSHLNQASCHDYGLRCFHQHDSDLSMEQKTKSSLQSLPVAG